MIAGCKIKNDENHARTNRKMKILTLSQMLCYKMWISGNCLFAFQ